MAFTKAEELMRLGVPGEQAKKLQEWIEGGGGAPVEAGDVLAPEITTAGGTVIPPGTLVQTLQAIADLADPA